MSLNTITSVQLLPAAIVSIGSEADAIASGAQSHYPAATHRVASIDSARATKLAEQLLADLEAEGSVASAGSGLPAIVIVSTTVEASDVVSLLRALRHASATVRPRIWPVFIAGEPSELAEFDADIDDLGPGACDLVLMMNGTASSSEKAAALGAWLHIKMPAPPSVLGELPDVDGKICRYVAIGSGTVSPGVDKQPTAPPCEPAPVDLEELAVAVRERLTETAAKSVSVTAANDAASALCAAAEDLDASALLRAENHLAEALSDVSRQLSKSLTDSLPVIIDSQLAADATEGSTDPVGAPEAGEGEASVGESVVPAAEDRTAAVSQLVLLASKGGLSKMLSRSRMSAIAQSVSAAARQDVADAVKRAVDQVSHEVPDRINAAVERRAQARRDEQEAKVLAGAHEADKAWQEAMTNCRNSVTLWPRVDTSGVRRSWGGSAPAPRHYVVGSESAIRVLPEDDEALSVIDLRDATNKAQLSDAADADADAIDLRDGVLRAQERRATVLLAQYGLPLAAFRTS